MVFPQSQIVVMELRPKNQGLWLVNFCHRDQNPRHREPGIRILGAFATQKDIAAYVATCDRKKIDNIFAIRAHEFVPIRTSQHQQLEMRQNEQLVKEIMTIYQDHRIADQKETERNIEEKKKGTTNQSIDVQLELMEIQQKTNHAFQKSLSQWETKTSTISGVSEALTQDMLSLSQRYAAIISIADLRPDVLTGRRLPEPLVACLYTAATVDECNTYIRKLGKDVFVNCDIDVVTVGEYLFPQTSRLEVPSIATDKEQQGLLDQVHEAIRVAEDPPMDMGDPTIITHSDSKKESKDSTGHTGETIA